LTGTVIAQSGKMQHVLRQVHRLGRYRWPVLLLGETGTGKEVFARALHEVDPIGPFVTIDCSAMVGGLMESELFGHARGAFTGAVAQKTGLIELANGGTAFFDEIGELPLEMQAKLLRVLQEKEYRPVGGTNHRRSEFRVIAATNRDLAREVERGTFRRDLYYRLNVVTLRLPALRDRMEDIPLLMDHFLERFGKGHQLTQETKAILVKYPWPGNVRELENCMKHMVSVNSGPYLHNADLPSMIQNHVSSERAHRMAAAAGADGRQMTTLAARPVEPVSSPSHDSQAIVPLVELERREILRALNFTKGDRVMAASLLGIGRTTLYRKIKEYNVAV
jgi:transcriptional regulator with PAS, ATPase and Fis domain